MKIQFCLLLGALSLAFSCSDNLLSQKNEEPSVFATKSVDVPPFYSNSESRIVYLDEIDFNTWSNIYPIENRFKASDISDFLANSMTTESLVESLLYYPLNYLILVHDNPIHAIKEVIDNSALHRELIQREDAAEILINAFANTCPTRQLKRNKNASDDGEIPYQDELFLAYFISSGCIQSFFLNNNLTKLKTALSKKIEDITHNPNQFSTAVLQSLLFMDSTFGFRLPIIQSNRTINRDSGPITIYTPFGKPLEGIYSTNDYDESLIESINDYFTSLYPHAILRGNSSARYNCHSYAWYQSDTTNCVWLNSNSSYYPFEDQISKYYTDDLYEETTQDYATHVRFTNDDHSALVLPSGMFLSKWGSGPLMEHYWFDSPYSILSLKYFKEKNLPMPDGSVVISGPSYVLPSVSNTYFISHSSNSEITYVVSCDCISTNDPSSASFTTYDGSLYYLTCYDYGAYKIKVNGYRAGYHYSFKEFLVICAEGGLNRNIIENVHTDSLQFSN